MTATNIDFVLCAINEEPGRDALHYAQATGLEPSQVRKSIWHLKQKGQVVQRGQRLDMHFYPSGGIPRLPRKNGDPELLLRWMMAQPHKYMHSGSVADGIGWEISKVHPAKTGLIKSGVLDKHPDDVGRLRGYKFRVTPAVWTYLAGTVEQVIDVEAPAPEEPLPEIKVAPLRIVKTTRPVPPPPPERKDSSAVRALEEMRDRYLEEANILLAKATALEDAIGILVDASL